MITTPHTGGCQCGAVRFAVDGPLGGAAICHCRMCQKATGAPFGSFVTAKGGVRWTRGEPRRFQSSDKARRGFCAACGTPLTFEWKGQPVEVAIGAFDDPAAIAPTLQVGTDGRLPWFADLAALPERRGQEAPWENLALSNQHPDHDTDRWPPA